MSVATRVEPHKQTREEHPAECLVRDERVQRALSEGHARRLAQNLNIDALGTIIVSKRPSGEMVVLDGAHRVTALMMNGLGEYCVPCIIHHGLSLADEARLFLSYNYKLTVNPIEKFRVAVQAEDPTAVRLDKLIRKHGFIVAMGSSHALLCVHALTDVYEGGRGSTKVYPQVVDDTLRIIADAWGTEHTAIKEVVLGIGHLLHRYPDIDQQRLVKQLAQVKNGAQGVSARVHYHREMKAVNTVREGAIKTVKDIYNEGLHKARKLQ